MLENRRFPFDPDVGADAVTDAQIEAIARAYCVKLGLDPDEPVDGQPIWHIPVPTVRLHMRPSLVALREAIAEALGEKGG
jgi:hypothetical protein